jgi:hypothetical protein
VAARLFVGGSVWSSLRRSAAQWSFTLSVVIATDDGVNLGIRICPKIAIPSVSRVARGRSMPFTETASRRILLLRPLLTAQLGVESTRLNGALAEI